MLLEPGLRDARRPRFDDNRALDFSRYGRKFDFFLARSVWTHAPKDAICRMLDGFLAWGSQGAVFLASYVPARRWRREDYRGEDWLLGPNRAPPPHHLARHSFRWIQSACRERGLAVSELRDPAFAFGGQTWLRITRA